MYQQYFGLSESPFSISPDPRYLFLSDKHREALAHLIYGVGDQGGFVVLTGEVGTGKTTICRCLLQQLPDNADIAFIINPKQSINQLLQSIFNDLGITYEKGNTSKDLIDKLNDYLLDAHARGRNTILIIDEAQNLAVDVLEQLRLLTNLETNEKKLLQLLLLGQPELNDLLLRPELRQLAQRVTARYHLSPLSKHEVTEYIQHRLSVAGCRSEIFPASAIKKIYSLSQGVPRLINLICDRTLLGVYATNSRYATPKIVTKATKEIFTYHSSKRRQSVWLAGLLALILIVVAAFVWNSSLLELPEELAESQAQAKPLAANLVLPDLSEPSAIPPAGNQLTGVSTQQSFTDSTAKLYQQWGLRHSGSPLCDDTVLPESLYCHRSIRSVEQLYRYNVPAALLLKSPTGETTAALLESLSGDEALLFTEAGEWQLSMSELGRYLIEDSVVLSRLHPELQLPVKPGDENARIGWLVSFLQLDSLTEQSLDFEPVFSPPANEVEKSSKMALLYAHNLHFKALDGLTHYDPALTDEVKNQQQMLGLTQTAIIDYSLLTAINQARYQTDPVLHAVSAKEG